MEVNTVHELFLHELKDVYSAEKQILKALPKLIKHAQDQELKANLEAHLEETKGQVTRLDSVFEQLKVKPQAHTCLAMQGILAEGDETLGSVGPDVIDLAITGSADRVEHYEIVVYSSLIAMATLMGHDESVKLLKETLAEETEASKKVETAMKKSLKAAPSGM